MILLIIRAFFLFIALSFPAKAATTYDVGTIGCNDVNTLYTITQNAAAGDIVKFTPSGNHCFWYSGSYHTPINILKVEQNGQQITASSHNSTAASGSYLTSGIPVYIYLSNSQPPPNSTWSIMIATSTTIFSNGGGGQKIEGALKISQILSGFALSSSSVVYGAAAPTITAPTSASSGAITYSSSNTSVATVSGSTITIVGVGTATLTATQAANGNYGSATTTAALTVTAATPILSGFTLSSSSVVYGAAAPTITAPTSASSGAITYSSSNTSVATVSGSTITIVGVGTATLTATQAANGNYGSATTTAALTVVTAPTPILTFATPSSVSVGMDGTITNVATSSLSGGNYGAIIYTSSNTSVATVNASSGLITPIATGTSIITATQASVYGVNQSATQTYTLTVVSHSQTISISATASTLNIGGTATVSISGSSGTGSLTFTSSNTAVATVNNSTGLVTGISAGSTTITATKAADANYASASSSLTITVLNPTTSITLTASHTSASTGQSITFTAQVSPSAATGTVTFKEGTTAIGSATLTSGQARLATSSLSSTSHTIIAVYNGDATYQASTSGSVTVIVSRPNPANDMQVRTLVASQVEKTRQHTNLHIGVVQRRLETLHSDNIPAFSNAISISSPQISDLPVSRYAEAPRSDAESKTALIFGRIDQQKKPDNPYGGLPTSVSARGTLSPDASIWTAGQVMLGGERILAPDLSTSQKTKFALSGITLGVDKSWTEHLKGGVSYSFSSDQTRTRDEMVKSNSRSGSASIYASWNAFDKIFVDAIAGYGVTRFSSARFDSNASAFLGGTRSGKTLFYSVTTSYDKKMGALFLAPFARFDQMFASLGSYTEAGETNWNLSYDRMSFRSQTMTLGLRGQYDFLYDFGVVSPTFRVEVHQLIDGQAVQNISYESDTSTSYSIFTAPTDRRSVSGALGLKVRGQGRADGGLELNLGGTGKGLQARGARGSLNMRF